MASGQVGLSCFSMSSLIIIQQFSPCLFMWWFDSKREKTGAVRTLKCQAWNWHSDTSVTFCWLKQVTEPAQIQGEENRRGSMHTYRAGKNFWWPFFVIFYYSGVDVQNFLIKGDFIKNIICKLFLYLFLCIFPILFFYFMHLFIPYCIYSATNVSKI